MTHAVVAPHHGGLDDRRREESEGSDGETAAARICSTPEPLLDFVLRFGLGFGLPLHIPRSVRAAAFQGHDVIHNIALAPA